VNRLIAPLPAGGDACTILWLRCVAREEALFDQAVRDPLTGIYNRRYFDEVLAGQVERSHRGQKVTLAYFDLDDFKGINDSLGHAAGDAALRAFVAAVKSQLRDTDVFARRGGDEFAVLFVDCETDVAIAAVERLREVLDESEFTHEDRRFAVHFSAGVAACRHEDSVDKLVARADRALYDVKEAGKAGWGVAQ
jgi:diguanylate cyclase (GGDEF)-like protein